MLQIEQIAPDKIWIHDGSTDVMTIDAANGVRVNTLQIGATPVTTSGAELNYLDVTAGQSAPLKAMVTDANGAVLMTASGKLDIKAASDGKFLGAGTSSTKASLGATPANGLSFYMEANHASGDMRGMYLRLYFSAQGGSGEAARIFSTINNFAVATGGTVNGAHISIGTAGANAGVNGAANALRCTFGIAAASTNIGGTCAVVQVDTDFDAAVTVPSNFAFLRFANVNSKKSNNLMRLPNVVAETGGLFCAHTTQTMTHSIKIVSDDGTPYYVMCTNVNTNRTES